MPPIRKGDGTRVAPKGISQVRTGDGRIFFDGPAIPDSDLYYSIDEGSGDVISDDQGDNDATSDGSLVWIEDGSIRHNWYVELDDTNYLTANSNDIISVDKDFSAGIEILVESEFTDDSVFWSWNNGNDEHFSIGYRDLDEAIGAQVDIDGYSEHNGLIEPSAPYNVDIFITWDAGNNDLNVYVDEQSVDENCRVGSANVDAMTIGANPAGGDDIGGEGVARFSIWEDEIVDPSEFTL